MTIQHARDIRAQLDLRELVSRLWGEGIRSGRSVLYHARWRSGDTHASFAVYANGYKDFGGTGESGDGIQFVMHEYDLSWGEAVEWLRQELGGSAPPLKRTLAGITPDMPTSEPPPADWQQHLRAACIQAQSILWSPAGLPTLDYLRHERGLTDDTIRRAGLGYTPTALKTDYRYLDDKGAQRRVIIPAGIVIPWEIDGVLWAVRVRSRVGNFARALNIADDRFTFGSRAGQVIDKYLSAKGSRPGGALYGADTLPAQTKVIFFEGEFDTLIAAQTLGEHAACVTFGSASNVPAHLGARWREKLAYATHIFSALDSDTAGQTATNRLENSFSNRHTRLTLPNGCKDITDYAQMGGDLSSWLHAALVEPVPDSWLTALLNLGDADRQHRGAGAPVYYALMGARIAPDFDMENFSVNDVLASPVCVQENMSGDLVRAGVYVLTCIGFLEKLVPQITPTDSDPNSSKNLAKNRGGRPADRYRLLDLTTRRAALSAALAPYIRENAYPVENRATQPATVGDISARALADVGLDPNLAPDLHRATLPAKVRQRGERQRAGQIERKMTLLIDMLDDQTMTPMPAQWRLGRLYEFRIAFLRALKLAGRVGSRLSDIAQSIGISKAKVNDYVMAAGFSIETDQMREVALVANTDTTRQIRQGAVQVQGKPLFVIIEKDQHVTRIGYDISAAHRIQHAMSDGASVRVVYQTANKHIPLDAPLPVARRVRPVNTLFPARFHQGGGAGTLHEVRAPKAPKSDLFSSPRRPGYRPEWVTGQIKLALHIMGWITPEGRIVNPLTGETICSDTPTLTDLIGLLLNLPPSALLTDGAVTRQDLRPFDLSEVARAFENRSLPNFVRPEADPDAGQSASSIQGDES